MQKFKVENKSQNKHPKFVQRIPDKKADPMGNELSKERYAQKIFRDIARGNFDIFKDYKGVFDDPQFIFAALRVAGIEYQKAMIHKSAIEQAYAGSQDPVIVGLYMSDIKTMNVYDIIYKNLTYIQQTGDLSYLQNLVAELPKYRHNI